MASELYDAKISLLKKVEEICDALIAFLNRAVNEGGEDHADSKGPRS